MSIFAALKASKVIGNVAAKIGGVVNKNVEIRKGNQENRETRQHDLEMKQLEYRTKHGSQWLFFITAGCFVQLFFLMVNAPLLRLIPGFDNILLEYARIYDTIGQAVIMSVLGAILGLNELGKHASKKSLTEYVKLKTEKDAEVKKEKIKHDAEVKKEKIKNGVLGDSYVKLQLNPAKKGKYPHVDKFFNDFRDICLDVEKKYGLCAVGVLTHAAIETGWGKSILKAEYKGETINTNNVFNIKNSKSWSGKVATRSVWEDDDKDGKKDRNEYIKQEFRAYDSLSDAVKDYAELLTGLDRYKGVLSVMTAEDYGEELYKAKYMTDGKAPEKFKKISEAFFIYET